MSINPKYAQKYDEAYAGIPMNIAAFETPEYNSVYGEENEWWLDVQPMYVPGVIPGAYSISNFGRIRANFANTRHGPGAILGVLMERISAVKLLDLFYYTLHSFLIASIMRWTTLMETN